MDGVKKIESFRDLVVWQKAMVLAADMYAATKGFPKEEVFGLTSQMRRCAVSVPSNIAEGYGRSSKPDYVRFLNIARGSLYELQTQLILSGNIGYTDSGAINNLLNQCNEIEKMLNSLIKKLGS